jgi:hypothetical protein
MSVASARRNPEVPCSLWFFPMPAPQEKQRVFTSTLLEWCAGICSYVSKNSVRSVDISYGSGKTASVALHFVRIQKIREEIACEHKNDLSNSKTGPLYQV